MQQNDALDEKDEFSIAVIGMSCRFPEANNVEEFWNNLINAKNSIKFFSKDELSSNLIDSDTLNNNLYIPASGFLEGTELFAADFFGFTPQEAQLLDPQFRIFFECAWEAFEDAGYIPIETLEKVGVFAGCGMSLYSGNLMNDYFSTFLKPNRNFLNQFDGPQVIIANKPEYLPTRVSYKFNFKGPSVNIQTACSTSLVAVHAACQSLLAGECEIALAGASALHFPQKCGYLYSEGGIFSSDGKCKSFSKDADGIVGGNGVGIVVLKRLESAIEDKDNIHAIIRATAINNDGNLKVSYMAPSVQGQIDVLNLAQDLANISPNNIGYIEAHGTGTQLGDPIEISALTQSFRTKTAKKQFCALGSVKTNIGHLDTAAGMAGLIKTVMILKNATIPPTLHYKTPNDNIDFVNSPFFVNSELIKWDFNDLSPRVAGISALGAGGTNAHIIAEEFIYKFTEKNCINNTFSLFTLCARNKNELICYINKFLDYSLLRSAEINMSNLCYTLAVGRMDFDIRIAFAINTPNKLTEKLRYCLDNIEKFIVADKKITQNIAYLYSGQGSQYIGMGKELYNTYKVFSETIDYCSNILEPKLGHKLISILWGDESNLLKQTLFTQPCLFAFEYALTQLWLSWGIVPQAVLGHSVGEYVAACIAGVMSLEDSLILIEARAKLMQELPLDGGMATIFATEEQIYPYIKDEEMLSIAAINGPQSLVLSGSLDKLSVILDKIGSALGIKHKMLEVSHAFHSLLMKPILESFRELASKVKYSAPNIPLISNITGKPVITIDANYWVEHLIKPVRFFSGINQLVELGFEHYLEVSPKGTLINMAQEWITNKNILWLESITYKDETEHIIDTLGKLFTYGYEINWQGHFQDHSCRKVSLPTYPFQRKRFWVDIEEKNIQDSNYEKFITKIDWIHTPLNKRLSFRKYDLIIIFLDKKDQLIQLTQFFNVNKQKYLIIIHGNIDRNQFDLNNQSHTINFSDYNEWKILFSNNINISNKSIGFIYLCGMGYNIKNFNLSYYQEVIYIGFLNLLQLEKDFQLTNKSDIWLVTSGVHQTSSPNLNLLSSPLWGIARSARIEGCPLKIFAIDFNDINNEAYLNLFQELEYNEEDLEINFDNHMRKIPVCGSLAKNPDIEQFYNSKGYYLITGGYGGLGLIFAEHLVNKGIKNIILLGRNINDNAQRHIAELQLKGANVTALRCDVTNLTQMQCVFKERNLNISAIIHAAGSLEDAMLYNQNISTIRNVMNPKILGAWNLYNLLKHHKLDYFISFSSIAAVLGSPGQTNYAAANTFLDTFSNYLQNQGINAKSINWGPWSEVGMSAATKKNKGTHNAAVKLYPLTSLEGLQIFDEVLKLQSTQIQVFALIKNVNAQLSETPINKTIYSYSSKLWSTINEKEYQARKVNKNDIKEIVQSLTAKIVGVEPEEIKDDTGFHDMGMDSLMGLQFRNHLNEAFSISLESTLIYKHNTIKELEKYLINLLFDDSKSEPYSSNKNYNINNLSESELATLLESELSNIT